MTLDRPRRQVAQLGRLLERDDAIEFVFGAQLNAILDPLARHRTSSIEDQDGNTTHITDERHGQRIHDALDDVCGRVLRSADQPIVGGIPASVIVTVQLEDLLAKAGLAETSGGDMLTADQLLRIC